MCEVWCAGCARARSGRPTLGASTLISSIKVWQKMEYPSLHSYIVQALGISEDNAYQFSRVALKCKEVPKLQEAIDEGKLTVSTARRILTVITPENDDVWITKASGLKQKELEKEVVKENPKEAIKERVKPVAENLSMLQCALTDEEEALLTQVTELESQRTKKPVSRQEAIRAALLLYVKMKDPVEKAKRNSDKPKKPLPTFVLRRNIPAEVAHQVNLRDNHQCAYKDGSGKRCPHKRWLEKHHIQPYSHGGKHTLENLITLCHTHHKFLHEFSPTKLRVPTPIRE